MNIFNSSLEFIKKYFNFLFGSFEQLNIVQIGAIKTSHDKDLKKNIKSKSLNTLKFKITLIVTYTMTFLIIVSFIAIIIYSLFFPDYPIPSILHDTFIALLGYFGGSFITFLKTLEK
jgi:hypothetical protein